MIRCERVRVRYPASASDAAYALDGVSLSFAAGEMVGILGPNGSGKTTLLAAVNGLLPLESGSITLDGTPIAALRYKERATRMACVPQRPETVPDLPVLSLVLMGRYARLPFWGSYSAQDKALAQEALAATAITHLRDRSAKTLSGGEFQRVLVARALAQGADILLLDEATTGLDAAHAVGVLDAIRKRNRERGCLVLAAIHDLNLAALYCDRLVFLKNGRIHADGPTQEVFTPAILESVYETAFSVIPHPRNGLPQALCLPGGNHA